MGETVDILNRLEVLQRTAEDTNKAAKRFEAEDVISRLVAVEEWQRERDREEEVAAEVAAAVAVARAEGRASVLASMGTTTDLVTEAASTAAKAAKDAEAAEFAVLKRYAVKALKWAIPFILAALGIGGGISFSGGKNGDNADAGGQKVSNPTRHNPAKPESMGVDPRVLPHDERHRAHTPSRGPAKTKKP